MFAPSRIRETLVLVLGVAFTAACGGTVVIAADDDGGGTGGAGASSVTSTGSSAICFTTEPSSDLFECGFGTTGSGVGPCERRICDAAGNEWRSSCEDQGCVCFFNGTVKCSCSLQGEGLFCDGVTPSCCPEPFPDF
ncbi:MAG TPA: hypothetical protein ENK57_19105 [Polyangiaceae bacterium]|nr:hypothetical protein [Polyangiaceae bacterium]